MIDKFTFYNSNNALEPTSLVICNGIVELVQVLRKLEKPKYSFKQLCTFVFLTKGELATALHRRLEAQVRGRRAQEDKTRKTGWSIFTLLFLKDVSKNMATLLCWWLWFVIPFFRLWPSSFCATSVSGSRTTLKYKKWQPPRIRSVYFHLNSNIDSLKVKILKD